MIHDRSTRNLICRILVGVLLYAQLALTAHACPGLAAMRLANEAGTSGQTMLAYEAMMASPDSGSPNLCVEHCQQGQQIDQIQAVALPSVILVSFYPLPLPAQAAVRVRPAAFRADALATAAPPHAILHCCFRI